MVGRAHCAELLVVRVRRVVQQRRERVPHVKCPQCAQRVHLSRGMHAIVSLFTGYSRKPASSSVQRSLLMPQVDPGSLYRCGEGT